MGLWPNRKKLGEEGKRSRQIFKAMRTPGGWSPFRRPPEEPREEAGFTVDEYEHRHTEIKEQR
jgi:hypothetical protein